MPRAAYRQPTWPLTVPARTRRWRAEPCRRASGNQTWGQAGLGTSHLTAPLLPDSGYGHPHASVSPHGGINQLQPEEELNTSDQKQKICASMARNPPAPSQSLLRGVSRSRGSAGRSQPGPAPAGPLLPQLPSSTRSSAELFCFFFACFRGAGMFH